MAHNVTKILCHPGGERSPLCVYNGTINAYACYFSDDENPPEPSTLEILNRRGLVENLAAFEWVPVVSVVGNPDETVSVYGEYNDDGKVI